MLHEFWAYFLPTVLLYITVLLTSGICATHNVSQEAVHAHCEQGINGSQGKQLFPHELSKFHEVCLLEVTYVDSLLAVQVINVKGWTQSLGVSAVLDVQLAAVHKGLLAQVDERRSELVHTEAPVNCADTLKIGAVVCPEFDVLSIVRVSKTCIHAVSDCHCFSGDSHRV